MKVWTQLFWQLPVILTHLFCYFLVIGAVIKLTGMQVIDFCHSLEKTAYSKEECYWLHTGTYNARWIGLRHHSFEICLADTLWSERKESLHILLLLIKLLVRYITLTVVIRHSNVPVSAYNTFFTIPNKNATE